MYLNNMFNLIKNGLVLQPDFSFKKQNILTQNETIYELLEPDEVPSKPVSSVMDLDGQVIFPGLINGHDHLIDTNWRPLGNMPVENWYEWESTIHSEPDYKLMQKLSASDLYVVGMYKNVISGATTIVDHFPSEVSGTFINHPIASILKNYYLAHSVSEKRLHWCSSIADQYRRSQGVIPFILHTGQGKSKEITDEIENLNRIGALERNTVLVGCEFLKESDLQLIASKQASIVWIPESSERLFNAQPNIKLIRDLGIKLCLGTDSTNTGSRNLQTAFSAALKHSAEFLNNSLTAKDLINMVTAESANIFGISKKVGTIAPGKNADFVIFEQQENEDPLETFIKLTPEDFSMVIHKGRIIIGNEEFKRISAIDFSHYSEVKLNDVNKIMLGRPVQLIERICNKLNKDIKFPFFDVTSEDDQYVWDRV